MTAKRAGEMTAEGVFGTLGKMRDRWVLLVFAASALFWARDVYERFVDLPARVAEGHVRQGGGESRMPH